MTAKQLETRDRRGAANGYASLDSSGTVPDAQIPATIARDSEITAAVAAAVAALTAGAPGALDTLNELAAALGNDASFASTVTNALAGKQPQLSDGGAWAATTAYALGDIVVAPSAGTGSNGVTFAAGDPVTPAAAFTSGASFVAANWKKAAAISPSSGAVTLRSRSLLRRDLPSKLIWDPSVNSDVPTFATSGPGGASPVSGTHLAYDTAQVTRLGCVGASLNALSTDYIQNRFSNSGSGSQPWAVDFLYYGQDLAVWFRNAISGSSYFWVWVDGQPVTAAPQVSSAASANSRFYYRVTWGAKALRRVRIYMAGADFGGLDVGATDTVAPTQRPSQSIAIIGDSYINGTGATSQLQAMGFTLGRALGLETYLGGVGGSGYIATGSPTYAAYGDALRVNPLATALPDYLLYFGSTNDAGSSSAAVGAAAAACFTAALAASPSSKLIVCTVQANSGSMSAANIANASAIATAAAAAGAVAVLNPISEGWITGTGHVGATTGSGNADLFVGTDGVHPSQAGHDYYARRMLHDIGTLLAA